MRHLLSFSDKVTSEMIQLRPQCFLHYKLSLIIVQNWGQNRKCFFSVFLRLHLLGKIPSINVFQKQYVSPSCQ